MILTPPLSAELTILAYAFKLLGTLRSRVTGAIGRGGQFFVAQFHIDTAVRNIDFNYITIHYFSDITTRCSFGRNMPDA